MESNELQGHFQPPSQINRSLQDFSAVTRSLQGAFPSERPRGYLLGKTSFRDTLIHLLELSAVDAEALVDALIANGFLRYDGDHQAVEPTPAIWIIDPTPEALQSAGRR